jgi:very-short-patch-repair endonuclease
MFYLPRKAVGGGPSAEERMVEGAGRGHDMRRTLITNRARAMRKAMTEPEVMLWSQLRGRGPDKPTFRRQHPFGSFILDFYCPAARLAIEVDGATHWDEAAQAKDEARDRWLMRQGVLVSRVAASEIHRDLGQAADGVLLQAEALIAADRGGPRLAPSTIGSTLRSADGPLPPLRGGDRSPRLPVFPLSRLQRPCRRSGQHVRQRFAERAAPDRVVVAAAGLAVGEVVALGF